MLELSVFLLGIMATALPVVFWQLRVIHAQYIAEMDKKEGTLSDVVSNLNSLHNNAMVKYQTVDARLARLESELNANKYGKRSNEAFYK